MGNPMTTKKLNKNGLTENQQIFCDHWLIHRNGTQAYKKAFGPDKKDTVAAVQASKLLRKANVSAYLTTQLEAMAEKNAVTRERITAELAKLAFLQPKNLFKEDGTLKALSELDDDVASAIAGLQVDTHVTINGENEKAEFEQVNIHKIKLWDKTKALIELAQHLGMRAPVKSELTGAEGEPLQVKMNSTGLKNAISRQRNK